MINVKNLLFSYTNKPFIKDMSFEVKKGEIFGFLGPSGAGKSTLQKILTGLITSYEGSVQVMGIECKNQTKDYYEKIGVDFEYSTMYEKFTARENLIFFQSLYKKQNPNIIEELLNKVGLLQDMDKKVSDYSKGMRSRLNFVKALLHDPQLIFLDEPMSGLDPNNRQILKNMILSEKAKGKTIILTTHNMEDASALCDRVAFIVNGSIALLDSPHNIIMSQGAVHVEFTYKQQNKEITRTCLLSELSTNEE